MKQEQAMRDVIVVGSRCAGSFLSTLLARRGYRVLLVDRATFPSDTISTHVIWERGGACLKRAGLFDRVSAAAPPLRTLRFDLGDIVLEASTPAVDGVTAPHAPRRTVLDKILRDAAEEAGAEVREGLAVEELLFENSRVVGIRGRSASGGTVDERATLIVGADGKNSTVARAVGAAEYDTRPPFTCWYYRYWSGVPVQSGIWFARDRRVVAFVPTSDALTCVIVIWPHAEFHVFRTDIEGNYKRSIEAVPAAADLLTGARPEERLMGTADLRNFYRKPYGPGWVLIGDAGHHKDPVTGLGISDAFCHSELLMAAIDDGLGGRRPMEDRFAEYEVARNRDTTDRYQFTCDFARLEPPSADLRVIFQALANNRDQASRFFGVITGAVPVDQFFAPENIRRLTGGDAVPAAR
jgi:2-polyprenyl-6-methoxyphenol hydroxylase-like FAD-dependent oxidoreductase